MAKTKPRVEFEPVKMTIGSGWFVRVALPEGRQSQLGGFRTEPEAREWIAREAAKWLKEFENGKYV